MTADCIGTAVPVTETAVALGNGGSWPDALARTPQDFGPADALPGESREAFAERRRAKHRAQLLPFPEVSSPALAAALQRAKALGDEMIELNTLDTVAQEFKDDDEAERQDAWMASLRSYEDALGVALNVPATTPAMAVEKINAFFAGQGCTLSVGGEPEGPMIGDEPIVAAFRSLWRDMQALAVDQRQTCPAARLLKEHEPVYAASDEENERGVYSGGATKLSYQYEERASWARARSLQGAMYQVALAGARNDLILSQCPDLPDIEMELGRRLDHRFIDRLLLSVMHCLHDHVGGEFPDMLEAYNGPALFHYIDTLSDDPQQFDADDFISRYTAAGGQLKYVLTEKQTGVLNTYPRDPGALAPFLSDLSDVTKFEAISVLLHERWGAHVNANHGREPE